MAAVVMDRRLQELWLISSKYLLSLLYTDFFQFNLDLFQPLSCEVETGQHATVVL